MDNAYIITSLIRRRAKIAGLLEDAQMRVHQLIIDVDNVDAMLRQFQFDIALDKIRPKSVPPRHTAFYGQNS